MKHCAISISIFLALGSMLGAAAQKKKILLLHSNLPNRAIRIKQKIFPILLECKDLMTNY